MIDFLKHQLFLNRTVEMNREREREKKEVEGYPNDNYEIY